MLTAPEYTEDIDRAILEELHQSNFKFNSKDLNIQPNKASSKSYPFSLHSRKHSPTNMPSSLQDSVDNRLSGQSVDGVPDSPIMKTRHSSSIPTPPPSDVALNESMTPLTFNDSPGRLSTNASFGNLQKLQQNEGLNAARFSSIQHKPSASSMISIDYPYIGSIRSSQDDFSFVNQGPPSGFHSRDNSVNGSSLNSSLRLPQPLAPLTTSSLKQETFSKDFGDIEDGGLNPNFMNFDEFVLSFTPNFMKPLLARPLVSLNKLINTNLTPDTIKITTLCLFWYASSAMTNNIAKDIFEVYSFPVTLTYVQFAFVAVFCFFFGLGKEVNYGNYTSGGQWVISWWDTVMNTYQRTSKYFSQSLTDRIKFVLMNLIVPILYVFVAIFKLLQQSLMLIRYWLALGLGIDEDAFGVSKSKTGSIPPHHRLCGTRIRKPSQEVYSMIFPLSAFLISGHVFSSVAISSVPVSFVHTIKALSPLFTVLAFKFLYNTIYSHEVWVSLIPLTLGVMLACSFEMHFSIIGLTCALASTLIFVGQNIFSKKLFGERRLDKLNMLLYSSSTSFLLMTPIWFYSEGYKMFLFEDMATDTAVSSSIEGSYKNLPSLYVVGLFTLNGISHFCQNVFAFSILSLVSPVTYSIASLIKRIVVIVMSLIYFGQNVGFTQGLGIFLTFFGLWLYHRAKLHGGSEYENKGLASKSIPLSSKLSPQIDNPSLRIQDENVIIDLQSSMGSNSSRRK